MLVVQFVVLLNITFTVMGSFPPLIATARFTDIQEQRGSTVYDEIDTVLHKGYLSEISKMPLIAVAS